MTSVSYGKNGNFDPGKIETLEQIDTQFIRIDYMHERNVYSKIGENPFTAFWAFGWNITFLWLFFLDQHRAQTPIRILMHNGIMAQKMQNRTRMCLLGSQNEKLKINPYLPSNHKNLAPNRPFPAKMMKHESLNISESTKPIEMKISHCVRNVISSARMQYDDVTTNPIWRTAAILKIVFFNAFTLITLT